MKACAVLFAGMMLLQSLLASLPAWCVSGSCIEVVAVDHSCCGVAGDEQIPAGDESDDCRDCVEVDHAAPIILDRTPDLGPVIAVVHRLPDLLHRTVVVADAPAFPTGPPRPPAILRDLRTIRLLI